MQASILNGFVLHTATTCPGRLWLSLKLIRLETLWIVRRHSSGRVYSVSGQGQHGSSAQPKWLLTFWKNLAWASRDEHDLKSFAEQTKPPMDFLRDAQTCIAK